VTTLPQEWSRRWAERPSAPVLLTRTGHVVPAGEVEERTGTLARRFAGSGVVAGDRVVVSAGPGIDVVLVHVALMRLGAVVVPVNPAATSREIEHVVREVAPVAAVTDEPGRFAGLPVLVTTPDVPLLGTDEVGLDDAPPGAAALIGFTSGTTGSPKGAVHTHRSLLAGAASLVEAWQWDPADRLVHALPLFHMHGLGVGLHGSLLAGASLVLLGRFDADAVVDAASGSQASLFFGVPTMYARLVRSPRASALRSLRLLVSGSAPLPADLFHAVERATGHSPLERYGMTETVMLTSNPLVGERRAGTVGLPLPGVEVRLSADADVEVRGPNVFAGYWQRDDATQAAFTDDGWFRTGDIGEHDDAGYLKLVGRRSDVIISGGFNVYPREVEDVLRAVPGVLDVAVVGVPDAEWGEVVTAVVVGDAHQDHLDAATLELSPYKRPRRWRRAEALPRNSMGKVVRDQLRDA
jgi:malonyl-CoA/methylmalonyl-CoA synthetase